MAEAKHEARFPSPCGELRVSDARIIPVISFGTSLVSVPLRGIEGV
jgi:hypothetical protein